MTTYLKVLPSLEHAEFQWSLFFSCIMGYSLASCLICYIPFSLFRPSASLIMSFLQEVSGQHIPEGIYYLSKYE